MTTASHLTLDFINAVLAELPCPLVGSVVYDGNKRQRCCTPKAFQAFLECYSLIRPRRVLEIGTHAGGSALMTLVFTEASIVSVDIGHTWITLDHSFDDWHIESAEGGLRQVDAVLNKYFPGRFTLVVGDSTTDLIRTILKTFHLVTPFDLAFIDGNHEYSYVKRDIQTALEMNIRHLILDDLNSKDNSDVARAVRECGLVVEKEWVDIHSGGTSFGLAHANF